jgi:hypothetical protein
MRRILIATLFASCAALVSAQTQTSETKTKTTVTVKDGRDVKVIGCIQRNADSTGFILTDVTGASGISTRYRLVDDDRNDLEERVGYRVEIKGKAADSDDAEIKTKSETEVKVNGEKTGERQTERKAEGAVGFVPYLGVKAIKTLAKTCV